MGLQKYRADFPGTTQVNGAIPYYTRWMGGPSLAIIKKCPIRGLDISPRTVYVSGMADTWFTQPAACKYKRKTIKGMIVCDTNGEYEFHAFT